MKLLIFIFQNSTYNQSIIDQRIIILYSLIDGRGLYLNKDKNLTLQVGSIVSVFSNLQIHIYHLF